MVLVNIIVNFVIILVHMISSVAEAQVVMLSPTSPTVTEYSPLTLTCGTAFTGAENVTWSKRLKNSYFFNIGIINITLGACSPYSPSLEPNSTLYNYTCPAQNNLTLTIRNVSRTENGHGWKCTVDRNGREEISQEETVSVQVGISGVTLSPSTDPINVIENNNTTLQCNTSGGLPAASVRWYIVRSGQVQDVTSLSMNTYQEEDNLNVTRSTLTFTPFKSDQNGSVYCSASNVGVEWNSSNPSINVLFPPAVPTIEIGGNEVTGTVKVIEENSKAFNCTTESNPTSNYSWSFPGGSSSNKILQVENFLTGSFDGNYTCFVLNQMEPSSGNSMTNMSWATISVDVLYPPRLPSFKYGNTTGPIITDNTIAIVLGDGASVTCEADANPTPNTYTWTEPQTNSQLLSLNSFKVNTTVQCTANNIMTETNRSPIKGSNSSFLQINVWRPPIGVTFQYHYSVTGSMKIAVKLKILAGQAFWLSCTADSSPPSTYTWSGHPSSREGIWNVTGGLNASQSVSCFAENYMPTTYNGPVRGNTSSDLYIDVLYGPKARYLQNVTKVRGAKLVYQCLYTPGNPSNVDFEWTKSGTDASWVTQYTQYLIIPSVKPTDEARYTCNVSSILLPTLESAKNTQYDTATFYLDVLYGPENLVLKLNNVSFATVEIDEHSSNHMECLLESDPSSEMALTKDGKTIVKRSGVHQLVHGLQAACSDAGVYTCSGYNQYGVGDNASMHLFVKCSARRPPGVDVQLNITARQHVNATLAYTVVAYPVPHFAWKRCTTGMSCEPLPNDMNKFIIDTKGLSSYLTVLDVQIEDYRMYQLSVSNGVGDPLVEWLHLNPTGKPDLPTDFRAIEDTIGERTATLTWVPGFDNGSPQKFHISYRKLVDVYAYFTRIVKHDNTQVMFYTVDNLVPGTEYYVSIYATNKEGTTASMNDTFQTLTAEPGTNTGLAVGGAIGGTVGAIVIIVVFVLILRRKYSLNCAAAAADRKPESGTDNLTYAAPEAYEDVSLPTNASTYDALKTGNNGPDESHIYTALDKKSSKSQRHYENVKKRDPVYNNIVRGKLMQTHC
ncbi:nephrin-like [Mya arenaria]|uniref:nephrin-like n=1 Tax=Mya arenaria TaxID=6604 RepID=UPI0022E04DCA|nr:nephrin-like [Mya arenaria]